jgi:peptide/nickel transport system ATP-binding protein
MNEVLLSVKNLRVRYLTRKNIIKAVDGVSFEIKRGETLGLTGESGCGKTSTALAILKLLTNAIIEGEVLFNGMDLLNKTERELQMIRGREISMIFQESTYLNPVLKIGDQINEVIEVHRSSLTPEKLLSMVGLPEPEILLNCYPHQLSSGMRQRLMIALAIASKPKLVIADEPTSMLDATIQLQILNLLKQLKRELKITMLFISHDLNILKQICDSIAVMYAGKIVELYPVNAMPLHPYTRALLEGCELDLSPSPSAKGCFFQRQCSYAKLVCHIAEPQMREVNAEHFISCHLRDCGI